MREGERGSWWQQHGRLPQQWWCGGGCNLTQSYVLGMTSLGGPVEVQCLGIAFAAGIAGRYGAEAEARMRPESLFYLACDGEIQINSCQSGGLQGEGLRWWGEDGVGGRIEKGNLVGDGGRGWQGWGLTDEVSVNLRFIHGFITTSPGLHRLEK